jgi:hypothetical protein
MTYKIVARKEIGLPETVRSSDDTPRPPLSNERWVTYHYTGVSSRSYNTADVAAEVRRIQAEFSSTKPFEYNYVIGQADDDAIYEFAGTFQAAHSGGENADSFGVLFLNAVGEPLTPAQIKKAQWLRDVLIFTGALRAQPEQRPHQLMPGAATACPGDLIVSAMPEIVKPYTEGSPYIPEADQWATYPSGVKPTVREGDSGSPVLYLNDVLRLKAGQTTCGDTFNSATKRGVRNLQRFFNLIVDGVVGPQTWATVDMLTGGNPDTLTWQSYGQARLVDTGNGTLRTADADGNVGAHPIYARFASKERFTPPYTWSGLMLVRDRLDDVFIESESRAPTWDWSLALHPMHDSNDENHVVGLSDSRQETVRVSAECIVDGVHAYRYRTGLGSRYRGDQVNLVDGAWHEFKCEVMSYNEYKVSVDGVPLVHVVEQSPATIQTPTQVALRLDFFDVELSAVRVTK